MVWFELFQFKQFWLGVKVSRFSLVQTEPLSIARRRHITSTIGESSYELYCIHQVFEHDNRLSYLCAYFLCIVFILHVFDIANLILYKHNHGCTCIGNCMVDSISVYMR